MNAQNEKSIYLTVLERTADKFRDHLNEVEIRLISINSEDFFPPRAVIEDMFEEKEELLSYKLVDSRSLTSETLLIEMLGRPDINSIRLLRLTYLDFRSILFLSRTPQKGQWVDGEDFWTFAEHAEENRRLLQNSVNIFFKVHAFNKAPGWRPNTEIFGLLDR